jgi:hypothetical protein
MEATSLRARFLHAIERFSAGELDIPAFWQEVEVLNREGFRRELKEGEEARVVRQFIIWYLDMYDPMLQPRPGLLGRLRDKLDEVFRAEYRVSPEELRAKAVAVERIMKQVNGHSLPPHTAATT